MFFEERPGKMFREAIGRVLPPEDLLQADLAAPDLALDPQEARIEVPDAAHPQPPAHPHRCSGISMHSQRVRYPEVSAYASQSNPLGTTPAHPSQFSLSGAQC